MIHRCNDIQMWPYKDVTNYVRVVLKDSISYGISKDKIILSLTANGLTNENIKYCLDQIIELDIRGLFIDYYYNINPVYLKTIKERLKIPDAPVGAII